MQYELIRCSLPIIRILRHDREDIAFEIKASFADNAHVDIPRTDRSREVSRCGLNGEAI